MMLQRPLNRRGVATPWPELDEWQRDMYRLFSNVFSTPRVQTAPSYPAMNVWTNQDGAVITAELPGVKPDDIDISVVGDMLTLSGTRTPDKLQEGERYHRRERGYGKFTRTFQLPFSVQADKVEATFNKGILSISLPRAEVDKPRKISVKTA